MPCDTDQVTILLSTTQNSGYLEKFYTYTSMKSSYSAWHIVSTVSTSNMQENRLLNS